MQVENATPRSTAPQPARAEHAPHAPLEAYYADESQRSGWLRAIFDRTAGDYDRMERVLGLGSGPWYRRQALLRAGLAPGMRVLDVATGTGLVARAARAIVGREGRVIGVDPSLGMLGADRDPRGGQRLLARGEELPFADASFDFLVMGFALRHLSDLEAVFREFLRVLRPGGRLLMLEITRPEGRLSRMLLRSYMRGIVPGLARLFARERETAKLYGYYWDTIEACVPPTRILESMQAVGFTAVDRHLVLGLFSEYRGRRR